MARTKTPAPLTVTKATSQARRIVDRIMPGMMATVDSKLSHDLATDTATVITTVTFPENADGQRDLFRALETLSGAESTTWGIARITVERTR
jgi:hypothetical protein